MSWRSFARDLDRINRTAIRHQKAVERENRRQEREAARQLRELEKRLKEQERIDALARARLEVEQFENYLDLLVSVHKQPGLTWDWRSSVTSAPPPEPPRTATNEQESRKARESYKPGFFDKIFGRVDRKTAALDQAIAEAQEKDENAYQGSLMKWREDFARWKKEQDLGKRVVAQDPGAYASALKYASAFSEIEAYGWDIQIGPCSHDAVTVQVSVRDPEIVPTEIIKLTASGKRSTKAMPKGQYWELYQDHICSCAIRIATETFSSLPVHRVIVNSGATEINSATGHPEPVTHLAVHFTRKQLGAINLEHIDPSDSMENFSHRMKFAKTKGFKSIEAITLEDQFITT